MKIKNGFIVRQIAAQNVAVPVGATSKDFHGMIKLNESALLIWEQLENDTTEQMIVSAILDKYNVSEEQAKEDVHIFIEVLRNAGILEE